MNTPSLKLPYRFLGLVLLLVSIEVAAQDLRVGNFMMDPGDISARENSVRDVNQEACALIKVRTGLNGVRFVSNLSVEKVEQQSGEYWVWVSPGTNNIKVAVNEFPLLDFDLPRSLKEFEVANLMLIATFPDRIIYRDTARMQPFVSFISDPPDAEVYINGNYYGNTPLKTNLPDSNIEYKLEKKHFLNAVGNTIIKDSMQTIRNELLPDHKSKRYFLMLSGGLNSYINREELMNNETIMNLPIGLSAGRIGKVGYYISTSFAAQYIKPDFAYITEGKVQIPIENAAGYYYQDPRDGINPVGILHVKDRFNLFRLSTGLTFQAGKNTFFQLGTGYSQRTYYRVFLKSPYDIIYSENTEPLSITNAYGIILDQSFRGVNADLALSYRLKGQYLLSFNVCQNFGLRTMATDQEYENLYWGGPVFSMLFTDFKIGVGYVF